jgi:drug/metabolite transporter (DMT)-like permease
MLATSLIGLGNGSVHVMDFAILQPDEGSSQHSASAFLLVFNLLLGHLLPGGAAHPADLWWLGDALGGWIALFLLAAGPMVIGFGLYNVSLSYLPASVANLIVSLEPVFTALLAYALFGERLSGI